MGRHSKALAVLTFAVAVAVGGFILTRQVIAVAGEADAERLNRAINAGLADATVRARLGDVATTPFIATPAEFGAYMATETERWAKVIRAAGIKPE